jgi:hypothetical protein
MESEGSLPRSEVPATDPPYADPDEPTSHLPNPFPEDLF